MSDGIKITYWNRLLEADKTVICTPQNFGNVIENLALNVADTIPHKDYEETTDNLVKLLEAATNQAREHQLMRKREKYIPNCSRQSSRGPAAHHDENIQRQDRINRWLDFCT